MKYQAQLTREVRYVFGMDGPIAASAAQLHQESGFNPNARSAYAVGIAQFTIGTAEWLSNIRKDLGPSAPLDATWSIRAMVVYNQRLYNNVHIADTNCDRYLFALSGYNGGEGWRISRQAHSPKPGSWAATGRINPGITAANQRQNQEYGPRIIFTLQPLYKDWGSPTSTICK